MKNNMFVDVKIETSHFANIKNTNNPVAICSIPPKFYKGHVFSKLGPDKQLLYKYKNNIINEIQYEKLYYENILQQFIHPQLLILELIRIFGKRMTLLCYENPNQFCHRHIVSKYIYIGTGIVVNELRK